MKTIVMNTAVMPASGTYRCREITQAEFVQQLITAENPISAIGYPATQKFLQEITGVKFPLSRERTVLDEPTTLLTVKLKYRLENPAQKKDWIPKEEDYEYFITEYRPEGYHEIAVSMDHDDNANANVNANGHFAVYIDNMPWLGSLDDMERLGRQVWKDCGELDLLNDYPEEVAFVFQSHQELMNYVWKATRMT